MLVNKRLLLIGQWALVCFLAFAFMVAVMKPIVLTASDLGRHLMNGKLFLEHGIIQTTNAYSYTHPDFPFLNHHWGSGVLFELARRIYGFIAVSIFGMSIVFMTAVLWMRLAWKRGTLWLTTLAAIAVIPVFAGRAEVRPELFSYLLSGIFLWILFETRAGRLSHKWFAAFPILILAWVNLHIYFFLGIGWIGAFIVDALIRAWRTPEERSERLDYAKYLGLALAVSCILAILNPNGWQGAVYPLFIFKNYAYAVAENQPVLRILDQGMYPPGLYLIINLCILFISWIWRLYRDWQRREIPDVALLILSIFVSIIAWGAIRNFTIFAYVTLVTLSFAWSDVRLRDFFGRWVKPAQVTAIIGALIVSFLISPPMWVMTFRTIGLGVAPNIMRSITFFKEQHLRGPIFNNYDIGGFLTYGLYPDEQVFVDNRPEAYPGYFFTDILLPMQMDEKVWHTIDNQRHFNVIFFYRHDATRWGQAFMIRRIQDPEWAPVFVDDFVLVFVRRTPENAEVVKKYEIPKEKFSVEQRDR